MLAVVAGALAIALLPRTINNEIASWVLTRITQHYQKHHLKVQLRSAEFVQGKGIRLRDLSILEPGIVGPEAELLHVDEALIDCSTDWRDLLDGKTDVRRVTVRRPKLRVTHRPDDVWSAGKLLPPPSFGQHAPEVTIENGVVEIVDVQKSPASAMTLRDVNFSLVPEPVANAGGGPTSDVRRLQGTLAADGVHRVTFEGTVDPKTGACGIRGQIEGLDVSPELRASLPNPLSARLLALGELRGRSDLSFELGRDASAPLKFGISGRLTRGRLDDPRLPHALTEIRTTVRADNSGWAIDDLSARSGQGELRMSCRQSGFAPTCPLTLSAELRQVELDSELLHILPPRLQDEWSKYLPKGAVDADVQLAFDGTTWKPVLAVRCLDVSFTHYKFPYRLEHGKGTLDLIDDQLKLTITAFSGSQPMRLTAEVANLTSGATGWFELQGDDIQIDKDLIDALRKYPKPQEFVRSLDPKGTVDVYVRLWRNQPSEAMHQHMRLDIHRGSIRYAGFPYPLSDIRGTVERFDANWKFLDFGGRNDNAVVTCSGRLEPGLQGNELKLDFVGRDVSLESQNLRDALSATSQNSRGRPGIAQVWHDLNPRGAVDLTADLQYLLDDKKLSVGVRVEPQRDNASIEPVHFPFRLEHLDGVFLYRDGHVAFERRCSGEHGAVKVSTDGYCDFFPDGRFGIHFVDLTAERLRANDRDLTQALPERLRKVLLDLRPTGSINLRAKNLDFERTGVANAPLLSMWDLRLGVQQSNLQCGGVSLDNVNGELALKGQCSGDQMSSAGELNLDSLNYKDCQFTEVRGPLWIDNGRILFGPSIDQRNGPNAPPPAQPSRMVTARLFGGTFFGSGWSTTVGEPEYFIGATLADGDLAQCARDLAPGRQDLRGKILVTADLKGSGYSRNRLSGNGKISLTNADVYQLPVMVSLLKLLRIRPPDQNAFSDATIHYRIEGEHIYLDPIEFQGDAISLSGKGDMDFQSAIHLTFHAKVGRGDLDLPVFNEVSDGVSRQIMKIYVDGTLQNPQTTKEALPGVSQVWQNLWGNPPNRR